MKIKCINNIEELKHIINIAKNVSLENGLKFTQDGLKLRIIDPGNAFLLSVIINKDFFEEYDVKEEVVFNMNFEMIEKIINSYKNGFILEDTSNELVFTSDTGTKVRAIKKLVIIEEDKKIPSSEYKLIKFDLDKLNSIINEIKDIDGVALFSLGKNLKIECKGIMERFEEIIIDNFKGKEISLYFSNLYLSKIVLLNKLSKELKIGLEENKPLYFELHSDNTKIEGWLAQRMPEGE